MVLGEHHLIVREYDYAAIQLFLRSSARDAKARPGRRLLAA